jgi:ER membrane protein complex subunit 7
LPVASISLFHFGLRMPTRRIHLASKGSRPAQAHHKRSLLRVVLKTNTAMQVLTLLLSFISFGFTFAQYGTIEGSLRLPDDMPVNSTRIALNNGDQITYSKLDGSFVFYNVPPGIHLLDVHSHHLHFSQIKVQLLPDAMDSPKCIEYPFPGATKVVIQHPIHLKAHAKYEYFQPKQGFSPAALLKNPMMLMMLLSIGMMFLMPKMMENLEPEERERMQKQMAAQQDPSKMLSNLWQDISGTAAIEPAAPAAATNKGGRQKK